MSIKKLTNENFKNFTNLQTNEAQEVGNDTVTWNKFIDFTTKHRIKGDAVILLTTTVDLSMLKACYKVIINWNEVEWKHRMKTLYNLDKVLHLILLKIITTSI